MKNENVRYITKAAVIAALYATLTVGQNLLFPGTASMAVQFRVAEVLTVLAIYTKAAIPGLTIGCIIANISSVTAGLGFYDMIFGSIASLLAAITMYMLRNVRIKNIPWAALFLYRQSALQPRRLFGAGRLRRSGRARGAADTGHTALHLPEQKGRADRHSRCR